MSKKYNNADSTLAGDLLASGTSFVLKTGEGALYPPTGDAPYQVTHEHYEGSVVTKREILTISARAGDAFTISTRASQICVQDDSVDPKTRTQNALSFSSGDRVYMTINENDFNNLETAINTTIPATYLSKTTYNAEKNVFSASSTGTDDYSYTDTSIIALSETQAYKVKADVANTGSCTFELIGSTGSLGVYPVKKEQGTADLLDNEWKAGGIAYLQWNSTLSVFQYSGQLAVVPIPGVDINGLTAKTTPVNADETIIYDSVSSGNKKLTWANIKATLKTYFDTLYVIKSDVVTTTRYANYSSTTQTISHSLGYIPKQITIEMEANGGNLGSSGTYSVGLNKNACLWKDEQTSYAKYLDTSYCIRYNESSTKYQIGNITAITSTNFTITWTLAGAPRADLMSVIMTLS